MRTIKLKIDTHSAGTYYGMKVYEEQVKPYLAEPITDDTYSLVFSANVKTISFTFVKALTSEIRKKIKTENFYKYFQIKTKKRLEEDFRIYLYL